MIATGGLGPTEDDITRQVSARSVGRELVYIDELETELRERFRRWGREMPEINKRQAFVIEGAEVLPNPNGSAAGMFVDADGKFFVILPGPPRENQPMFEEFILPKLREKAGEIFVKRKILRVSGLGESAVDATIAPVSSISNQPDIFNRSEVEIHLTRRLERSRTAALTKKSPANRRNARHRVFSMMANDEKCGEFSFQRENFVPLRKLHGRLSRKDDCVRARQQFIEGVFAYSTIPSRRGRTFRKS